MIQTLKKYSFWICLMPAALIILIELLGVADLSCKKDLVLCSS